MQILFKKFRTTRLKNKIFFASLTVILLLSFAIALFTRWVLISSLTQELITRGKGIAASIADSSRSYILTENVPELTSLIFDARLGHRKPMIAYIFIVDKRHRIISHTFIQPFPPDLPKANPVSPDQGDRVQQLEINEQSVFDIAVPILEGIYQIGTVHVGLKQESIDRLIVKLRNTFVGFLSAITIIFFGISHLLSRYIANPITRLTHISNEIYRGNLDLQIDTALPGLFSDGPAPQTGDEVMQLAHAFADMTVQLKQSRQEILSSEEKYRSLFNSGPNPIFVLDRKTLEILDANPSTEDTYGYTKEAFIGKHFTDFGEFRFESRDLGQMARDGWPDGYILDETLRYYQKGGKRPLYIRIKASPAVYKNREALILATTDITEMVEKDAQLIQASKMSTLGQMSAGIAHELNQPLNAIKLGNEYVKTMVDKGEPIPDEQLREVADSVSEQVDRASGIIQRLREFGRKTDFGKEKVNLNDTIQRVLGMIGQQLSLDNIRTQLDLCSPLASIMGHKNRLEQVLVNLITNARDALNARQDLKGDPAERRITVSTLQQADQVILKVSDTGNGIPKDILDKIFEPFFTTKDVGKGMGLGLSIIYGIVKDYGGKIEVQSEAARGTTFSISFPAVSA